MTCRRQRQRPGERKMSDLPADRIMEDLPLMQACQKWNRARKSFAVGDLVLVMDDSIPRNSWPLGRVTETITDSKRFVHRVRLRTQAAELKRPITKLCLLLEEVHLKQCLLFGISDSTCTLTNTLKDACSHYIYMQYIFS